MLNKGNSLTNRGRSACSRGSARRTMSVADPTLTLTTSSCREASLCSSGFTRANAARAEASSSTVCGLLGFTTRSFGDITARPIGRPEPELREIHSTLPPSPHSPSHAPPLSVSNSANALSQSAESPALTTVASVGYGAHTVDTYNVSFSCKHTGAHVAGSSSASTKPRASYAPRQPSAALNGIAVYTRGPSCSQPKSKLQPIKLMSTVTR